MSGKEKYYFEDDSSLWNDFISGDDEAYNTIYNRYAKSLFIQGLQYVDDKEVIKDCLHDIFTKIYANRTNLKPVSNVKLYLFIALKNTLITVRKNEKIFFEELDEDAEYIAENITIEDIVINRETEKEKEQFVSTVLSVLTHRQREAVNYRLLQNMTIDEICVLMDMNYQSVQNLLQRSIKKIRDYLKKHKKSEYKMWEM